MILQQESLQHGLCDLDKRKTPLHGKIWFLCIRTMFRNPCRYCSQESAADEVAAAFSGIIPGGVSQVCVIMKQEP